MRAPCSVWLLWARRLGGAMRCLGCGAGVVVLWLLAGLSSAGAHAEERLQLTPGQTPVVPWSLVRTLPDPGRSLGIDDVLARRADFISGSQGHGSLGVRNDDAWLWLPLEATAPSTDAWVLSVDFPVLNEVDIYLVHQGQVVQQALMGNLRPYGNRPLHTRTPALALDLRPGVPYDVVLRVRTAGAMIVPLRITSSSDLLARALREQMLQGVLVGLALCLLAYSAVQWRSQREPLFLYYAILLTGTTGFSLQFFGVGSQYLWRDQAWMEIHSASAAGLVAVIGSFLFMGHALADASRHRRFLQFMHAGAAVTALVLLAYLAGLLGTRTATGLLSILGPLPSFVSLPIALARARRGDAIGGTLVVAWSVYCLSAVTTVGLVQGWLPVGFWTLHAFQFGATLDMLLFLRVLGLRTQAVHKAAMVASRERDAMHSLAHSDPLTGLPNRRGLHMALTSALSRASRDRLVAVYVMDLDGFKPVNDQHGHDVGDELLVAVTRRLQGRIRQSDVVARLGGDEFVVLATHLRTDLEAHDLGMKLLDAFRAPFSLGSIQVQVGLTIGYAIAPTDSSDPGGLVKLADAAMYSGKQSGKFCLRRSTGDLALASA